MLGSAREPYSVLQGFYNYVLLRFAPLWTQGHAATNLLGIFLWEEGDNFFTFSLTLVEALFQEFRLSEDAERDDRQGILVLNLEVTISAQLEWWHRMQGM